MTLIANARMYSVTPSAKAAWSRLFGWVLARAEVDAILVDHDPPKQLSTLWEQDDLAAVAMCGLPLARRAETPIILAQPVPSLPRYGGRAVYCTDIVIAASGTFSASTASASYHSLRHTFGARVGYTLKDSQSGYYALRHHLLTEHADVPEPYADVTGGLINPRGVIAAIVDGRIDVGPLDGYVHDLIRHSDPDFAAQVRIVATTKPTPMPPIVATAKLAPDSIDRLRAAFKAAIAAPELTDERDALLLADFATPDPSAFDLLRERANAVDAVNARSPWPTR